jgi:ketol-acid reductoisomerase
MDWMYSNCSATAQRGALDWRPKFKNAVLPVFRELYKRVSSGKEAERVIKVCSAKSYPQQVAKELAAMRNSEMWKAGEAVRALRPKAPGKIIAAGTKGVGGRAG